MTLATAFASSLNTAAVRLATKVGLDKVVAAARDLGLDAPLTQVPSLALGTNEVSLLDLTGAFASVRAGRRVEPWESARSVSKVTRYARSECRRETGSCSACSKR